ncbi:MAG: TldD/PmbA family protein [Planctomycetota bacterium]|nr:MAG: TldD/PmbA family protein [Planctomycetota bacterium]
MNKSEATQILEKVLGYADAEETVAAVHGGVSDSTRFSDNAITQNVSQNDISLNVTSAYGQSHGSASTNDLSDGSLKALVKRAEDIAKISPPDPEHMPPVDAAESGKYTDVKAHFDKTVEYDPISRARDISTAIGMVNKKDLKLSGAFSSGYGFHAMANSAGLRAYHRSTNAETHMTVLTPTSSGWAEKISENVEDVNATSVAETALRIAENSQDPAASEPGEYTVILRPAAVAELLMFMFWGGFDAKATDEGRTFLRDKLGTKICGENITIYSDHTDPNCPGSPFQGDGLASRKLNWIKNGVVENLSYSRYWAKEKGKEPTGWPSNILMEGGDTSVDEMIASTDKCILVTRFWYIRTVDPMVPLVTGMTRDGLFLIENGKIAKPLKHLRFNVRLLDVLSRVEALSPPERTGEYFGMLIPAVKTRDFNFTSTTEF